MTPEQKIVHYRIFHGFSSTIPDHAACNPKLSFSHESKEWAWTVTETTCPDCIKEIGRVFAAEVLGKP